MQHLSSYIDYINGSNLDSVTSETTTAQEALQKQQSMWQGIVLKCLCGVFSISALLLCLLIVLLTTMWFMVDPRRSWIQVPQHNH